jgi:urea transporter
MVLKVTMSQTIEISKRTLRSKKGMFAFSQRLSTFISTIVLSERGHEVVATPITGHLSVLVRREQVPSFA